VSACIHIRGREIGEGRPVYVVAELSANHQQNLEQAIQIVHAAAHAGADAIKLQTYTPDTMTLRSAEEPFRIGGGTAWDGQTLYELYSKAQTPWEWHAKLKQAACDRKLDFFSSAFDTSAVNFLEELGVAAHKVASFELVDIPLIQKMASTGKPLILSTGMATFDEIDEAIAAAKTGGATEIALLKCTSSYPAKPEQMNLRTIPEMKEKFGVPIGLSDHSMDMVIPVAAVALGASIVEKHITLTRTLPGPDSSFSLEPEEFKKMVQAIRTAERALGSVEFGGHGEESSRVFRRSLFVVEDVAADEVFTATNVRSIRPGYGLHPRFLHQVLGRRATRAIRCGTPLSWDLVARASAAD
jgi:pseudaminic acid synthase